MLCGCGYVGEPLPPLLNIPQPVPDLSVVQRGPKIMVQFTLPRLTTEGVGLRQPLDWDLLAAEPGPGEFRIDEWAARAKSVGGGTAEEGRVQYEIAAAPWIGKDVVFAARVRAANKHLSPWSRPVAVTVIAPPAAPHDLKAENVPQGVRLTWRGAGPLYNVYRRAGNQKDFVPAGSTEAAEYLDKATEYGQPVHYVVQAVVKTGSADVESDLSEDLLFTPKDLFPPAVPTVLSAVPTTNSIELAWERVTDADLAGYRIYRAPAGGEFAKIGETAETPSYGDRQIESGKVYRYAVTAFDKAGNESKPSEAIEVTAP
jgi:fibronectin type 3 domain-containing protein